MRGDEPLTDATDSRESVDSRVPRMRGDEPVQTRQR